LIDHGFLDEDDPVELLDGLLLVKEPQHSPRRTAVLLTVKALERGFGEGSFVQAQSPINMRPAAALHLALATSARSASLASFDARLAAAARAVGLAIYPA
jgi:predicted nucleic acid-binding protein